MNQPQLAVQPCPKCNASVTIVPQAGMGACQQCSTTFQYDATLAQPYSASPASLSGTSASTPPETPTPSFATNPTGATMAYFQRFGKVGMAAGVVIVLGGVFGFNYVKNHYLGSGAGTAGYGALGLDAKTPEADKLVPSVEGIAKRWAKDAVAWELNVPLRADGKVNVQEGTTVTYISLSAVQSQSKSVRKNSIKKFSFTATNVNHGRLWGATDPWTGVTAPPLPTCSLSKLAETLGKAGLSGEDTARVQFDPQWGLDWRVSSDKLPALSGTYSAADCSKIK